MGKQRGTARIGTSGYVYPHWEGVFYPESLPQSEWFGYFAQYFDTVEINNTFYNLPDAGTFQHWHRRAPEGFLYVLKFSRYGTHMKCLKDPEEVVGNFMERARLLSDHLGPILVQLRPGWHRNEERLDRFLHVAPSGCRWAVEFRDETWLCESVYGVLRHHNAALVIHDMIDDHPRVVTADWVYLRYHGADICSEYSYQKMTAEARRVDALLERGLDVYAYFNNDAHGWSIQNATQLRRYVESRKGEDSSDG